MAPADHRGRRGRQTSSMRTTGCRSVARFIGWSNASHLPGRQECAKLAGRCPDLPPGGPGEVRLIAESEIRGEPGQVRISSGEAVQGLLHPKLATVPRQRYAGDVTEGTAEVEGRDTHHAGKLGEPEVRLVAKELSDLIGERSSSGSGRCPAQPRRLSREGREEVTREDHCSFEQLECLRTTASSGKERSVVEIEVGPNDEVVGKAMGPIRQLAERRDRGLDDGAGITTTGVGDLLHRPRLLQIADHWVSHEFYTIDATAKEPRPDQYDGQAGDRLLRRPCLWATDARHLGDAEIVADHDHPSSPHGFMVSGRRRSRAACRTARTFKTSGDIAATLLGSTPG